MPYKSSQQRRSVRKRLHTILTGKEILTPESNAAVSFAPLVYLYPAVPPEVVARSRKSVKARLVALAKNANRQWQDLWEQDVPRLRVLCLCEEIDNPLLWSHYANGHRGVAFRFDTSVQADSLFRDAERVKYRKRPPRIFLGQDLLEGALGVRPLPVDEKTARRLVMTKAFEWSYEKEWRTVLMVRKGQLGLFSDLQFSPRSLTGIFLGCHISLANNKAIKRLTAQAFANVEIYEAYKTTTRFGLAFKRVR